MTETINLGHFYFLRDDYYEKFQDANLMRGGEDGRKRPCFCAVKDSSSKVFWMIPISSKVEKYKKEHDKKIEKYGNCDTILFGQVLGHEKAFLIQNMFPTTEIYIDSEYLHDGKSVAIEGQFAKMLSRSVNKILAMLRHGKTNLVFTDVLGIEKSLL